jgi:curli biogenesis system outer membrane secretion channel CsgG
LAKEEQIMKKNLILGIGMVALICTSGAAFADRPVMGVAEFTNEVSGMHWWNPDVGWELSGMLTNELAATGGFDMVERSKLEHVLREQDLGSSGRVAPGTAAQVGKLAGAQYLVMGTVTAFEEGTKGTKGGIGFKGIRVGGKKGESYIAVDLRVVDSTTGRISYTRSVEARAKSKGVSVSGYRGGFSGSLAKESKTPTGKVIRAVVVEIADYLDCVMVKQDGCKAGFDAKEAKRRESLKKGISLD